MILSDRFIFVHVPKTGGQSITRALGGKTTAVSTHTPLRCVNRRGRFAFGFVRNPWARMVSLYRFLCQKPLRDTDVFDQERVRKIGFSAWLMEDEFFMQEDHLPGGEPWVIREKWTGDGGDLLPMQRRPQMWWLAGCDYIGQFETMGDDFAHACRKAGISIRPLPHVNATRGGDWRAEYGDREAEFVAAWFASDVERFAYAF